MSEFSRLQIVCSMMIWKEKLGAILYLSLMEDVIGRAFMVYSTQTFLSVSVHVAEVNNTG